MIVSNVKFADLEKALAATNVKFKNNVRFKDGPRFIGHTRSGADKYSLTLTVNRTRDDRQPGQKRGPIAPGVVVHTGKIVAAACWHVHGYFMDALPPEASIRIGREKEPHKPGDPWQDYTVGFQVFPLYASEACNCSGGWEEK